MSGARLADHLEDTTLPGRPIPCPVWEPGRVRRETDVRQPLLYRQDSREADSGLRRPVAGRAGVAFFTLQQPTDRFRAAFRGHDPGAIDPGRVVANMLIVAACKLRDPMALVVLVEAGDFLFHECASVLPMAAHPDFSNPCQVGKDLG